MMIADGAYGPAPPGTGRERAVNSRFRSSDSLCRHAAGRFWPHCRVPIRVSTQGVSSSVDRHSHRCSAARIVTGGRSAVAGLRRPTAADVTEAATLLAAVPAAHRVALVDPRFVGHRHALRLALTDPRFAAAAVPGALTAQAEARPP